MHDDRIALEGACNFRDLGGYRAAGGRRVRRGRAYRSDTLHRLTPADVAVLERLDIARVFDLRSDGELESDGIGPFAASGGRHVHTPLVEVTLSPFDPSIDWSKVDLRRRYVEMLESGGAAVRAVFESLAAPAARPVVFHCTGGKDRTGVVSALVLRALGVDDDDIVEDYSVSQAFLAPVVNARRRSLTEMRIEPELIEYLTSSPPERMRFTLGELDRRWGSTEEYLQEAGVGPEVLGGLVANLLD